jgi:hypothetical protein
MQFTAASIAHRSQRMPLTVVHGGSAHDRDQTEAGIGDQELKLTARRAITRDGDSTADR